MPLFRYSLKTDWPFYLLGAGYLYTLGRMTLALWFGDGVNVFATYSDAALPPEVILDANKVYWTKSGFLFSALLLIGFNVDIRAAFGLAAMFWASSIMLIFGAITIPVLASFSNGALLVGLQLYRRGFFTQRSAQHPPASDRLEVGSTAEVRAT